MSVSSGSCVSSRHSFVNNGVSSNRASLQSSLEAAAADFILNKDFKTTFDTCDSALKKIANCKQEDERFEDIEAAFCVLGVQALAELNEWHYVLPWVLLQYEQQEKIPAKIMQMCILLHTKVGETGALLNVTSAWLHCTSNTRAAEYMTVMELYLLYVLIPLGHLEKAQDLIQGRLGLCTLTEEQRQTALDIVKQKLVPNPDLTNSSEVFLQTNKPQGVVLNKLVAILKYLYRKLLMNSAFHPHKVFLFVFLVYILYLRNDPAHPSSFMWISKLSQLLRQMWTALFALHYPSSRK